VSTRTNEKEALRGLIHTESGRYVALAVDLSYALEVSQPTLTKAVRLGKIRTYGRYLDAEDAQKIAEQTRRQKPNPAA